MGYIKVTDKFWQSDVCTGFGNRLPHWALAYKISEHHDFKFTILLDSYHWPETNYVDFPYTESTFADYSVEQGNPYYNMHGEFIELIYDESILDLDTSKNYYLNGGPDDGGPNIDNITAPEPGSDNIGGNNGIYYLPPVFKLLKLKNPYLKSLIKDKVSDSIGIHVRKNNVTLLSTLDHYEYKEPVDIATGDIFERNTDLYESYKHVDFVSNFDRIIQKYKEQDSDNTQRLVDNQLFYISSDISTTYRDFKDMDKGELFSLFPDYKEFSVTKELYQKYNCIDYSDIIPNYNFKFPQNYLNEIGLLDGGEASNLVYFRKILRDVIDLFSLIYCKDFIPAKSTWSDTVSQIREERSKDV